MLVLTWTGWLSSISNKHCILKDGVRSSIVEIWDYHWWQNLVLLCCSIQMAFNSDRPCSSSDRNSGPLHDTAPILELLLHQCSNQHSALQIISHPLLTECELITEHVLPPHVRFNCRCCWHQHKRAWRWMVVIVGLWQPYELRDSLCGVCSWSSEPRDLCQNILETLPANLWNTAADSSEM